MHDMSDKNNKFRKRKRVVISSLVGTLFFIVVMVSGWNQISVFHDQEALVVSKRFSAFQSDLTNLLNKNTYLLSGYIAYIETEDISGTDTASYLQNLLIDKTHIIRNVTVIEDTTIKWVYPLEGNEAAIGVDLTQIEEQKDIVLRIKNDRINIMQGPVDLVQGGIGYIIRIPMKDNNSDYYGQLSIVLDGMKFNKLIGELAQYHELNVYISKQDNSDLIYGDENLMNAESIEFDMNTDLLEWKIFVEPINGWDDLLTNKIFTFIISIAFALAAFAVSNTLFKANDSLHQMAIRDNLTSLHNRNFLEDYHVSVLNRANRKNQKVGFILLDLNRFKHINDTYGHKVGDCVLTETARRLLIHTREDEMVFRLGGDEFFIMLQDIRNEDELETVKLRLKEALNRRLKIDFHDIDVTASIGYAIYPDEGRTFDEVFIVADRNMYLDKPTIKQDE